MVHKALEWIHRTGWDLFNLRFRHNNNIFYRPIFRG
nr:MAG TPA: hypothetical protein [Caudoviricetes sp.]